MKITLLIYNPGVDRMPSNIDKISEQNFVEITTRKDFQKNKYLFSCDDKLEVVNNYNDILTKKLVKYIHDKQVDVCILQEVCTPNIDMYQFLNYVGSYYRYDKDRNPCKKLLLTGSFNQVKVNVPKFIYVLSGREDLWTPPNFINKQIVDMPHDNFQTVKLTFGNKSIYVINLHDRLLANINMGNFSKLRFHLVGLILCIIKYDGVGSNIIICGDCNCSSLFPNEVNEIDESFF
jgi:hypothetical protein